MVQSLSKDKNYPKPIQKSNPQWVSKERRGNCIRLYCRILTPQPPIGSIGWWLTMMVLQNKSLFLITHHNHHQELIAISLPCVNNLANSKLNHQWSVEISILKNLYQTIGSKLYQSDTLQRVLNYDQRGTVPTANEKRIIHKKPFVATVNDICSNAVFSI